MTDTPKDRDDEAVEVMAQSLCDNNFPGPTWQDYAPDARNALRALRSEGYIVARPVADEGLSNAMASIIERGSDYNAHETADAILPLIRAREAALRDQVTNLHRRAQKAEGTLDRYKRKGGQRHWFDFAVRQRNRALKAEAERDAALAALAEAEKQGYDLHRAYLRLRAIIPGAFDTPHAPTHETVWATTENAAKTLCAALRRARAATGAER